MQVHRNTYQILIYLLFPVMLVAQPQLVSIEAMPTNPQQNGLFELNVQLNTAAINPYNFTEIRLFGQFTAPDRTVIEQDGFYFQPFSTHEGQLVPSGDPFWKIRFTPRQIGTWAYTLKVIDQQGFDISEVLTFQCLPSDLSGFVSFQDEDSYLTDDEGNTVFLIGENIAWADYQSGNDRMHAYMHSLSESGANFAKLMMVPWSYSIEWGNGNLMQYTNRQDRAFMVDSIFSMSQGYGLYLQLAFSIHNELKDGFAGEDWLSNPYNAINGGPCNHPWEFFTNAEAKGAFKNRMRYISARWGYAAHLFGWELLSEADNFPYYSDYKVQIAAWAREMASWLHEHDLYQHPVSVGFALTTSDPDVWNHDAIGFTQIHYYTNRNDIEGDVFRMIGIYRNHYTKPVLVGEYGIGHVMDSIIAQDPMGWALHNGLWASAMSGSLGSVVPWYWDAYIHALNLYYRFSGISVFMENEHMVENDFQPVHIETESSERVDFVIHPSFSTLADPAPSRIFDLKTTGILIPSEDSLSTLLFGPHSVFSGLRNPPIFRGIWPDESVLSIETGNQVNGGVLQISLDGLVVFEESVAAGGVYQLTITAGEHLVMIDNVGTSALSIIEINEIFFHDYLPKIRAFGLLGNNHGLVWIHNRNNNWKWYRQNNQAPDPVDGSMLIPYYSGIYEVETYSTLSGELAESVQRQATEDGLLIPIVGLSTDQAMKVSCITHLPEQNSPANSRIIVFPNPGFGSTTFSFKTDSDEPFHLEIVDMLGRVVYQQEKAVPSAGICPLVWNTETAMTEAGVYIYHITSGSRNFTGKIILE